MKPILIFVDQPLTMELLQEVADKCYKAGYEDSKNERFILSQGSGNNEIIKTVPNYYNTGGH